MKYAKEFCSATCRFIQNFTSDKKKSQHVAIPTQKTFLAKIKTIFNKYA